MGLFRSFVFAILLVFGNFLCAQNQKDSIQIQKKMGNIYFQNGIPLNMNQLMKITKVNDSAYQEMRIAQNYYAAAYSFSFVGGALIGWPLGGMLAGGEFNWKMAALGAGFIGLSIPFSKTFDKHAEKSIQIYNLGLHSINQGVIKLHFGLSPSGIGLRYSF